MEGGREGKKCRGSRKTFIFLNNNNKRDCHAIHKDNPFIIFPYINNKKNSFPEKLEQEKKLLLAYHVKPPA